MNSNHFLEFDTPTYLAENSSATYEDLMKYCVLPQVQTVFPTAEYMDKVSGSYTYPAIKIPWADGTLDGMLYLIQETAKTTAVGTSNLKLSLSCDNTIESGGHTDMRSFMAIVATGSYSCTYPSGIKASQYPTYMRILKHDNGYNIGFSEMSSSYEFITCSVPYFITKFKKSDDTEVNGVISYPFQNGNSTAPAMINVNIVDNGAMKTERLYVAGPYSQSNNSYWKTGEGVVYPLTTGAYTHETFYLYSGAYTTLSDGNIDNSSTTVNKLKDEAHQTDMWIPNAFTVGGQAFDAWLLSDVHTNALAGVGICRKHI